MGINFQAECRPVLIGSLPLKDHAFAEVGVPVCDPPPRAGDRTCVFYHRYQSEHIHLSSTLIRGKISRGEDVGDLVSEEVHAIMKENKLYER